MATTKHNHGPNFGRREPSCPRCTELDNGAEPVEWRNTPRERAAEDARRAAEIRNHDCRRSNCGIVCTAFDW